MIKRTKEEQKTQVKMLGNSIRTIEASLRWNELNQDVMQAILNVTRKRLELARYCASVLEMK